MNKNIGAGVARFVARNRLFRHSNYEDFAKSIVYLVNKYGVGGDPDYELGNKIQRDDLEYTKMACGYIGGDDIAVLLHDYANTEITSKQAENRALIKGVTNA